MIREGTRVNRRAKLIWSLLPLDFFDSWKSQETPRRCTSKAVAASGLSPSERKFKTCTSTGSSTYSRKVSFKPKLQQKTYADGCKRWRNFWRLNFCGGRKGQKWVVQVVVHRKPKLGWVRRLSFGSIKRVAVCSSLNKQRVLPQIIIKISKLAGDFIIIIFCTYG